MKDLVNWDELGKYSSNFIILTINKLHNFINNNLNNA